MACYLSIEQVADGLECHGCTVPFASGPLIAWTDELLPGKLVPVCPSCLTGLDPPLARFHDLAADLAIAARVIAEVDRDLLAIAQADPLPARPASSRAWWSG